MRSVLVLAIATVVLAVAAGAAPAAPTHIPEYKAIKWAIPTRSDDQIAYDLEEIERLSSRFNIDYHFALAVFASEASFRNGVACYRKWNLDFAVVATHNYGEAEPKYVLDDLDNAVDALARAIEDTKPSPESTRVERILRRYWIDPRDRYNEDTLDEFLKRFYYRYNALKSGESSPPKTKNWKRDLGEFPHQPRDLSDFTSSLTPMPNLERKLLKFENEREYQSVIRYFNPNLDDALSLRIARSILTFARDANVDARLVVALIACESRFRPNAVSPKGAMGLGQLMPGTARSHGIRDPFDPVQNVYVTVKYLERELARWQGDSNRLELVLASYNAGPGAVKKYGGIPPFRETRGYVERVLSLFYQLSRK